jgi:hypothetical protein
MTCLPFITSGITSATIWYCWSAERIDGSVFNLLLHSKDGIHPNTSQYVIGLNTHITINEDADISIYT